MKNARVGAVAILTTSLTMGTSLPAAARVYHDEEGRGYTVRCTTLLTSALTPEIRKRYEVAPDPDKGLLSCVLQQDGAAGGGHQHARVSVSIEDLSGRVQLPEVREVLEADQPTYIAAYEIPPTGPLSFQVRLEPVSPGPELVVDFDDIRPRE
jgi:hypothetical protein